MGWNELEVKAGSKLLRNLPERPYLYFAHSYYVPAHQHAAATCIYSEPFTAVLEFENVYGVQFHPEKSGALGLQIVKNFVDL
jgi:imidazole glycerol phosphate synthase glutamine amidotransferase subunit